jgi:rhodanese-related sulfurtransferase
MPADLPADRAVDPHQARLADASPPVRPAGGAAAPGAPETAGGMVAAARRRVRNLTPGECAAAMARGALVLDVREAEELRLEGTLPGALHVPRGVLEFVADPSSALHHAALVPDRPIVVVCAVGGRSALAADTLGRLGYSQVAHLEGGLEAWRAAGRPLVAATTERHDDRSGGVTTEPPRA